MKLNEIKKVGFYTDDLQTRETIFEVIENTDSVWLKDEPECKLLIDTWSYDYTDDNDIKHYQCDGTLIQPRFAEQIDVFEIKDMKYEVYGNSGGCMKEKTKTYKEKYLSLLDSDQGTLEHLKKILPIIEHNKVAYEHLEKVIEDMEKRYKGVKMKKDCMFLITRLNGKVQAVHPLDECDTEVQIYFESEYLTDKDIRFLYDGCGFGGWCQTYEAYLEDVRQRGYARKEEKAMHLTCELSQYTVKIEHKEIDFE